MLNKITEKRRRIMEEKIKPVAKMKMKGKGKCEKGKNTLKKTPHLCSQSRALRMEDGDAE